MLNHKKICFICCVNDNKNYKECLEYINKIEIPNGYEVENISIKDGEYITKAYNEAMKLTDAKYKIYIHEDLFIVNKNFIKDIVNIFENDKDIGMIGIAGSKEVPVNGIWQESNLKYGKYIVVYNGIKKLLEYNEVKKDYEIVKCIDGLIMITQYDVPWREDLFTGWSFYDSSQSYEFVNAGYKVVVSKQDKPWCINECRVFNYSIDYEKYRQIFLSEYLSDIDIKNEEIIESHKKEKVLILSHTNYINCIGGTEKYIHEQVQYLNSNGIDVIQAFPVNQYYLFEDKKSLFGVNNNQNLEGYFSIEEISKIIEENKSSFKIAYVHHLMFWTFNDISYILKKLKENNIKIVFYAHDFFFSCPSIYNMEVEPNCILFNENNSSINYCLKCSYGKDIEMWRTVFRYIFTLSDEIIAPSEFLKNKFINIYPEFSNKILLCSHLNLINKTLKEDVKLNSKIKLAYLGYRSDHKGWKTWEKIYKDDRLNDLYEFNHIGCKEKYANNVSVYFYSFRENGIMAAVDLLKKTNIDIVILWSTVPESYSYTMYEAIAAGIPILTNKRSGNIAETIKEYDDEIGISLKNEEELILLLLNKNEINKVINHKRYKYDLEYKPIKSI